MPVHLFALFPLPLPPRLTAFDVDTALDDAIRREAPKILHLEDDALANFAPIRHPLPYAVFGPQAAGRARGEFLVCGRRRVEPGGAAARWAEEDVMGDGGNGEGGDVMRDEDGMTGTERPSAHKTVSSFDAQGSHTCASGAARNTHDWTADGK